MRGQSQGRDRIPPVYSNGAVEQPIREIRQILKPRAFVFKNRARLNHLLTLMRLARLRVDTATDYAADIRAFLNAHDGHPPRTYRETYDRHASASGEILFNSLWASRPQLAMAEARRLKTLADDEARRRMNASVPAVSPWTTPARLRAYPGFRMATFSSSRTHSSSSSVSGMSTRTSAMSSSPTVGRWEQPRTHESSFA